MSSTFSTIFLLLSSAILVALAQSTTTTTSSSSSPLLFFTSVQDVTACASATISWIYAGPDAFMTLQITNDGVPQQTSTSSAAVPTGASQSSTTITLSSSILPSNTSSFNWAKVVLNPGTYIATAAIPALAYNTRSLSFLVRESNDTSCLSALSTSTSASTSPSSASASSSTSPSTTAFPVSSSSSSVNKAAIAGGVIGGAVLLFIVLMFYLFVIRRKRPAHKPPPSSASSHSGPAFGMSRKGWGGLSSIDSHTGAPGYTATPPKRKRSKLRSSRSHLVSTAVSTRQQDPAPAPQPNGQSEEEMQSYHSANGFRSSEEKFSSTEGLATLPFIGNGNASTRRHSSIPESLYNEFGGAVAGTKRRPSVNSTASLPPGARRPSIDSPSAPSSYTPTATSPIANVAAVDMDRTASGGSSTQEPQKKKTPRKPVPAYVPSSSPPPPAATTTPMLHPSTSSSSFGPISLFAAEAEAGGGRSSHYGEHELSHKSSFGPGGVEGKPLHYLIPDMPA